MSPTCLLSCCHFHSPFLISFLDPLPPPSLPSLQSLAIMLSVIPLAARGPAQIFIFDIHNLQERFYFSDQVIPRFVWSWDRDNSDSVS